MRDATLAAGYQLDTTPVDTLMAAPLSMHLQVAEDLENDHFDRPEPLGDLPEGFQEWDPDREALENYEQSYAALAQEIGSARQSYQE